MVNPYPRLHNTRQTQTITWQVGEKKTLEVRTGAKKTGMERVGVEGRTVTMTRGV